MTSDKSPAVFSVDALATELHSADCDASTVTFLCALSGGRDSMVLLDALHRLGANVRAVHVNHGVQAQADSFVQHCQHECAARNIELEFFVLEKDAPVTNNIEERLRILRRECFAKALRKHEVLLTAHHRDDQIETFFLQLMRGAGPRGLQGMPHGLSAFGAGQKLRPLLNFSREQLAAYAAHHQLAWVEDPSNTDQRFSRNFIRTQVLPLLWQHFPGGATATMRSICLQQDAQQRLDEQAADDITLLGSGWQLDWRKTARLSRARQAGALRYWLQQLVVRAPSHARLCEAVRQFAQADAERAPVLVWAEGLIQRYRDSLVYVANVDEPPADWSALLQPGEWLSLPGDGGQLCLFDGVVENESSGVAEHEAELAAASTPRLVAGRRIIGEYTLALDYNPKEPLTVRFRQQGERLLKPDGHHQSLKQWFQEQGIAPVLRARLPLVLRNREVIAIAGRWKAHVFDKKSAAGAWRLAWRENP